VFLQGFIRKRRQDIKDVRVKSIFHHGTQVKKNLEDTRRRPTEGGPIWNRPRSAPCFYVSFSTALGFASSPLIQVGLIRGLWFIPSGYISKALPLGLGITQVI
jgi:hypothetical protein